MSGIKPILHIWLYDVFIDVKSHNDVLKSKELSIETYDTSFFDFHWLDTFDDVYIHWKVDGESRSTSLKECLANECPYLEKEIRPEHNMQKIFWGTLYKKD